MCKLYSGDLFAMMQRGIVRNSGHSMIETNENTDVKNSGELLGMSNRYGKQ